MLRHTRIFALAIAAAITAAFSPSAYAQWNCSSPPCTTSTTGNIRYSNGYVGIGTTNPTDRLNVQGGGITLGVPYESPDTSNYTLTVQSMNPGIPYLSIQRAGDSGARLYQGDGYLHMQGDNGGATTSDVMVWSTEGSGAVGIGTTDPCTNAQAPSNCKLSVAVAIQAYDITVNNSWSDYVFDPDYRLAPLSEVAGYIRDHLHLPNIPSAAEVQEKGVSVGDMQAKLLAKIEELTLHMIEAEEENRELRERITR